MRFNFYSKEYPGAPDLTSRSQKIGYFTSTTFALVYAALIIGVLMIFMQENAIVPGMVSLPVLLIVLPIIRKVMFKKLDEEYAQRMQKQ